MDGDGGGGGGRGRNEWYAERFASSLWVVLALCAWRLFWDWDLHPEPRIEFRCGESSREFSSNSPSNVTGATCLRVDDFVEASNTERDPEPVAGLETMLGPDNIGENEVKDDDCG